jgi:MraZ protein
MLFTGNIERSIDDKHRLSIPTEMRCGFAMGSGPSVVYASPGGAGSIFLWPEATFESMANSLDQSLLPDEEVMEYEQLLFSQTKRIEVDKAGRIRLPESLLEFANIKNQVVVIGVRDHLELRTPEQWNASLEEKLPKLQQILAQARGRKRAGSKGEQ